MLHYLFKAPETYPSAFVEWFYGDAAPNLARVRPLLVEELFRSLMEKEELEYSTFTDCEPYFAASSNRFDKPEILAIMSDVQRRSQLLQAARLMFRNKSLSRDVACVLKSTPDDFMRVTASSSATKPQQILQDPKSMFRIN